MTKFTMTVGGAGVTTGRSFDVINPASGNVYAKAPYCSHAELDAAMDAAAEAFEGWRSDEGVRRQLLARIGDLLVSSVDDLAPILTAEQGKSLADAKREVLRSGAWFKYFAELEIPRETIQNDAVAIAEVVRRPLGVVAAITPWNFPLSLASWKIAPALLAGNTMVLKPSPFTPLTSLRFGQLLRGVLPNGVLNVVSGGDDLGAWMASHPVPRKISFTGSVVTGKLVAAAAAPDLKRVTLELGGNDPAIVLNDVEPSEIAEKLFWGAFSNNGQICSAIKRVYVPEARYDEYVEALVECARNVVVGDGMVEGTQLGPINNKPQFDRVKELVDDAIAGGARAAAGGKAMDRPGYFFEPTILADIADGTRIVDEEQFGPALPIIAYRDVADAVKRANTTHFGLSGSVWTADLERGATIAGQLECGTAWVNTHLALAPHQPFGGAKWSGLGVENGPWGLLEFTEIQVLYRAKG